MLITFKSKAAGDVIMFGDVAARLLDIMGKDGKDPRGIVTVEQLPQALAALRQAVTQDRAKAQPNQDDDDEDAPRGMAQGVSLAQRAIPLIDLLTHAQRESQPVIWEGR